MEAARLPLAPWGALGLVAFLVVGCNESFLRARHCHKPEKEVHSVEPVIADPMDPVQDLYMIAVGDLLEVKFPYRADLSETVTVREDGMIAMPLIDPIMAVGKTPEQLQAELTDSYKKLAYDPSEAEGDKKYLLQVNDVLDVKFDNQPQFNDSVIVRPDGKISLALIKSVSAEGKTPEQLEVELVKKYSKFLKNPELTVIVRQFTGDKYYIDGKPKRPGLRNIEGLTVIVRSIAQRQVYVAGEVARPGFMPYQYPMTAMQAIMSAGGHLKTGMLHQVIILRKLNAREPMAMMLNLKTDLSGMATNDISLRPYDIVYVPRTPVAKVNNFMQQYIYDLAPITKNSTFSLFYQIRLPQAVNFNPNTNPAGGQ